jgi:integrase
MATVNFLYRSTKDKAALNIRLLYRHDETDYVIGGNIHLEVEKTYWKKQHTLKRPKDIHISNMQTEVNQELNKIENYILNRFNNSNPGVISKQWLKLQLESYYNPKTQDKAIPVSLTEYIDFYIKYRKHELKDTSIRKYQVVQNKLIRFQDFIKKTILIKEVNGKFKNDLVEYLKDESYAQNTIQRDLTSIKTFCKHARYLGLETDPQLDSIKIDKQKVVKTYLSFIDLEQIEKAYGLPEYLDNARDWLIISCYTGQRISDFMRFTKEMIRIEDGKTLIEFTQKKTGKLMTVPLHKKVLEILDKRAGEFPRAISDQKYNDFLKEVCKEAELFEKVPGSKLVETGSESGKYRKEFNNYEKWELVSSHIGRRSFASNFYGQIPTTYLIYITGHSTETEFLKYIGKSNKDLAMEISKYF